MRIIVDTGVFFHPAALRELAAQKATVVVPAVAFAERSRQLRRQGRDVAEFARWLAHSTFDIEPFGADEAHRAAAFHVTDEWWRRSARDAFIASHLGEGDVLWTTNPRDFRALGLDASRVIVVPGAAAT